MHSIAQSYYESTHKSDFRHRMISGGNPFPFDLEMHDSMRKESCIVGMVMAWSVVTLETFVNHALAENLNNKISAIMAIEYPNQVTDKLNINRSAKSELAKKLIILSNSIEGNIEIIELADKLTKIRNAIVHDKPFSMLTDEEGEVDIEYFKSRGEQPIAEFRYEDLQNFYEYCDTIKNYILSKSANSIIGSSDISFCALGKG